MGTQLPLPQRSTDPHQFSAHDYCSQTAGWIKIPHGMEGGLGPGDFVLDGAPAPPKRGHSHGYCGQMAGWIKMPLGMEVGLGQGDIVLDGDPAPPKGEQPPPFSAYVYCGQTARGIKMPLGMEVRLGPGDIVLDGDPAPPTKNGDTPHFRSMSIVAKQRSPISATAELL